MNKKVNPLLPLDEFIPDVEARVFTGSDGQERVFLYGSHDNVGNETWCSHQYRVYSAPVDDLGKWTDHGVTFASRAGEGYCWNGETDGVSWTDKRLYAPDVLLIDGRYWLVSCFEGGGLGMSWSNRPEGPFCPAVQIRYDDGEALPSIDPALYAEDGRVYLLWGQNARWAEGLVGVELEKDESGVYCVARRESKRYLFGDERSPDKGFGFYEGPSIRKLRGRYYVLYPSDKGKGVHMMSYATADAPLGPYTFGGNILDNDGCDLMSGNDHGSLCEINGKLYLFYHRGFGNSNMRRKVCVEELSMDADGRILPVDMTNHGFGGPLSPYDWVEAAYATHVRLDDFAPGCYFEERGKELHPLTHITDGNCVEYRDFDFGEACDALRFEASIRPMGGGAIELVLDDPHAEAHGELKVGAGDAEEFGAASADIAPVAGVHTLYLRFRGNGNAQVCELAGFRFEKP